MDKEARRAERARIGRLSRLPFLYDFAQQGRTQALVATLVQVALAIGLTIGASYLLTGEALPRYVALVALAVAYAVQALARFLNARAGRR
ncbi:MAG: hypothetical protein JWM62_2369 [Frankiales bacterium]|jgi:hypothetical protein|nr:hypothetical protein [Frankiales bacterium]